MTDRPSEKVKADDRKKKDMETIEFLDRQVEAKRERKEADKAKKYRLGACVHADVQANEDSKREHTITHQTNMDQHLSMRKSWLCKHPEVNLSHLRPRRGGRAEQLKIGRL